MAQQELYDAGDAIPSNKPQVLTILGKMNASGQPSGCGAALVASNVLLTAAHCLDQNTHISNNDKPRNYGRDTLDLISPLVNGKKLFDETRYNDSDVENPTQPSPTGATYDLIYHPHWDEDSRATWNDVALIVFNPPVSRHKVIPLTIAFLAPDHYSCADYDVYGVKGADSDCLNNNSAGGMLFLDDREGCTSSPIPGFVPSVLSFSNLADPSEGSAICSGDSGSPILNSSGHIAALNSTINTFTGSASSPMFGFNQVVENYAWLIPTAMDRDGDGILAPDDPCDTDANNEDTDGDGIGDACDRCPYDADNDTDSDGDLVPDCMDRCDADDKVAGASGICDDEIGDSDCDGHCNSVDNCPFMPNSLQLNNNLRSEEVHHALGENSLGVGDACEPVLVPDGEPEDGETWVQNLVNGTFFKVKAQVVTRDEIIVRPQPSRKASEQPHHFPDKKTVEDVETHFRFCQETPLVICTDSENVHDDHLERLLASASEEDSDMPYHRITMSFRSNAKDARGATKALDYDGGGVTYTWLYEDDGEFWTKKTGIIPVIPPPAPGPTGPLGGPFSGLNGTFWMHAESDIGHPGGTILDTGVHPGDDVEGTQLLANRYFDLQPEKGGLYHELRPLELERPLFYWEILPDPPPWRTLLEGVRGGDDALLVATPGDNYALVNPDGGGQIVTERLGEHLFENLQDETLRWTSAVEPSLAFGTADAPMALGLRSSGLIAEQVHLSVDQEGLLGERDIGGTPPPGTAAAQAAPTGPSCSEFEPVYSRMLGRLFLLGCLEVSGDRSVWRADVADGAWSRLAVVLDLGAVRAATLSHSNGLIYFVDEAPGAGGSLRLVQIDPYTGASRVLAQSDTRSNYDRHWLVSDRDGSLLLTASSDQMNETVIARIDVRDFTVTRAYKGKGPLAERPIVQRESYHLYRPDGQGTSVERIEELENKEFSWHRVQKLL